MFVRIFSEVVMFKTKEIGKNKCSIVGYTGDSQEVIIPSEIEGQKVTKIEKYAFADCRSLTKIDLQEGLTRIGEGAFLSTDKTDKVDTIIIPSSVIEIGKNAFGSCNFTSVKMLAKNPPSLAVDDWYTDVFDNVPATILMVPCESKPLYDASDWHNHFTKIIRDCFAVESVETNISTI